MTPDDVRNYWLGELSADSQNASKSQMGLWYGKDESVDQHIRETFAPHIPLAIAGEFDAWQQSPKSAVALIILMDQFSRNAFRDSPQMYAADPKALSVSLALIETRADRALHPIERMFVYLPLEHSEEVVYQDRSVELAQELAEDVSDAAREGYLGFVNYALKHREIVARFGRFPHRNAILGRINTDEESEFLTQPGSSF
jgi:uncharacterized protein (DUF924 family)